MSANSTAGGLRRPNTSNSSTAARDYNYKSKLQTQITNPNHKSTSQIYTTNLNQALRGGGRWGAIATQQGRVKWRTKASKGKQARKEAHGRREDAQRKEPRDAARFFGWIGPLPRPGTGATRRAAAIA